MANMILLGALIVGAGLMISSLCFGNGMNATEKKRKVSSWMGISGMIVLWIVYFISMIIN